MRVYVHVLTETASISAGFCDNYLILLRFATQHAMQPSHFPSVPAVSPSACVAAGNIRSRMHLLLRFHYSAVNSLHVHSRKAPAATQPHWQVNSYSYKIVLHQSCTTN